MTTEHDSFISELEELLDQIEQSMAYTKLEAKKMDISPFAMRHSDGSFAMANLLDAKARTLSTLILLKEKQERARLWLHKD